MSGYTVSIKLHVSSDSNPDYYNNLSEYTEVPYENLVEIEQVMVNAAQALVDLGRVHTLKKAHEDASPNKEAGASPGLMR